VGEIIMKINVGNKKENALMKREEVEMMIDHSGKATPSRIELLPEIAKTLKTKDELVIIDKIFHVAGKANSKVKVFAYKKKDDIPKLQAEKSARRSKAKAPKEPEKETPKKEEPAEKPKEEKESEKKEEPKVEKKTEEPKKEESGKKQKG